ncbi:MAG: S8 family serine peptidase [Deltaproteobacteria bacterium]|nr:S8 family serine peptidase [Deltaproteobacteria bacterium]
MSIRSYLSFLFFVLAVFVAGCESSPSEPKDMGRIVRVQQALVEQLEHSDELVDVIINFRGPETGFRGSRRDFFRRRAESLITRHREGLSIRRRFMHVPAFAARITRGAFERLRSDPEIEYLQLDGKGRGGLAEAVPAVGGDQVERMYGVTGAGVRVAVLDTGAAATHPDLIGKVVAQQCFTQSACPPLNAREGEIAEDDHGHGSNVTGIIASTGVVAPAGFAPGVELISVKINDRNNSGMVSDWVAGLDWIYDNLADLQVDIVNMSICTIALYSDAAQCDRGEPAMAAAVNNLVGAGVTLFASSGNSGLTEQMTAPACNTGVVAVGATYDSDVGPQPPSGLTYMFQYGFGLANCADGTTAFDQIACITNAPERLDLVAPGAPIISVGLNDRVSEFRGTSQASPAAAGVAALMLECNPQLTPAEIKQIMLDTGEQVVDPRTNRSFPSLRALTAVEAACSGDIEPVDSGVISPMDAAMGDGNSGGNGGSSGVAGDNDASGALSGGSGGGLIDAGGASGIGGTGVIENPDVISGGTGGMSIAGQPAAGDSNYNVAGAAATGSGIGFGAGSDDGCGCRVPGSGGRQSGIASSLAFFALLFLFLCRRARLPR